MRDILDQCNEDVFQAQLPDELLDTLQKGWSITQEGALLLEAEWPKGMRNYHISSDEIGDFEYEINDVIPSCSDIPTDRTSFLTQVTARGLTFAAQAMRLAWDLPGSETMLALVNTGIFDDDEDENDYLNQGVKIRIFTQRPGYPDWIHLSLERAKQEALAVLDRDDITTIHN